MTGNFMLKSTSRVIQICLLTGCSCLSIPIVFVSSILAPRSQDIIGDCYHINDR